MKAENSEQQAESSEQEEPISEYQNTRTPALLSPRAIQAANEILARWETERQFAPLDRIVGHEFRNRRYLNAGERRGISEAVYGSVRFWRRQTRLLELLHLPADAEARIQCWLALSALTDKAATDEAQDTAFVAPDTLRAAWNALPGPENPQDYLRVTLSFPDTLATELETLLGAEAVEAGRAFNTQAATILRVNTLRATRGKVQKRLPEAVPTRYSPFGLELPRRVNIFEQPGFREGWYEVQEEASQIAALLADARPGQTVVDVGAGAGGKTLLLAALMENQGRLVALDTLEARMEELHKRVKRAGVKCVEAHAIPTDTEGEWQEQGMGQRWLSRLRGQADCALLDAPCTGSGVLRRSPDAKWNERDSGMFTRLQQTLLRQASEFVRPGGVVIYISCALERSQNEDIVAAFLESPFGSAFQVEPAVPRLEAALQRAAALKPKATAQAAPAFIAADRPAGSLQSAPRTTPSPLPPEHWESFAAGPYLRTWPQRQGMDAFFAACLRRASQ